MPVEVSVKALDLSDWQCHSEISRCAGREGAIITHLIVKQQPCHVVVLAPDLLVRCPVNRERLAA